MIVMWKDYSTVHVTSSGIAVQISTLFRYVVNVNVYIVHIDDFEKEA